MSKKKKYILLFFLLFFAVGLYSYLFIFDTYIEPENPAAPSAQPAAAEPPPPPPPPPPPEQEVAVKTNIISESDDVEADNAKANIPPIYANYKDTIGFANYVLAMQARGAVVFFFSKTSNIWKEINFRTGSITEFSVKQIGQNLSSKVSPLSKNDILDKYTKNELPNTEIFLTKPIAMENAINENIRDKFNRNSIKIADILSIRAYYLLQGQQFFLKIEEIVDKNAGIKKFEAVINL